MNTERGECVRKVSKCMSINIRTILLDEEKGIGVGSAMLV
jgi:hypothetical protein